MQLTTLVAKYAGVHALDAWRALVQLLGAALHPSRAGVIKHVNDLLQVPSAAFTSTQPAMREAAFESWWVPARARTVPVMRWCSGRGVVSSLFFRATLIDNFGSNMEVLSSTKRLRLLLTPLLRELDLVSFPLSLPSLFPPPPSPAPNQALSRFRSLQG